MRDTARAGSVAWAAVALAVTLAACTSDTQSASPSTTGTPATSATTSSSATPPPSTPATWRDIAAPPAWGYSNTSVWDGSEVLTFGVEDLKGTAPYCHYFGLAYDPATDRWRSLPPQPAPVGCFEGSDRAVWTGKEALLWGVTNTAYNPTTNTWRKLPRPPAGGGGPSAIAWTGKEMVGWGGGCCDADYADGAAYAPKTNSWRLLPPSPLAGRHAAGAWTGSEFIIAGGSATISDHLHYFADAAAYVPKTNTWRKLPRMPVGRGGGYYSLSYATWWTGSELLVVGGNTNAPPGVDKPLLARGVAYDPSTDAWRTLAPMAYPRSGNLTAWTGDQLIVWGGVEQDGGIPPTGESYDLATNTWSALPKSPLRARVQAASVWTGEEVVIWGGFDARTYDRPFKPEQPLVNGAALTPASVP